MGCDFFIIKQLEIKYIDDNDDEHSIIIELHKIPSYFDDESDDDINVNKYLQVNYKPCVLFQNDKWKNNFIQEKYYNLITNQIGNDILLLSVIKTEIRHLRF